MKALVESVMKYVEFPSQPWAGYEYTPKTEDKIMELAKAVGMDTEWVDPIGFACLQCEQDFSNPRVCFDCDVWELTEKEFQAILITLSSNSD